MIAWKYVSVTTAAFLLAGCAGGGETSTVSPPTPPPPPTTVAIGPTETSYSASQTPIPSPATRSGTYDAIALIGESPGAPGNGPVNFRFAAPGEIRISSTHGETSARDRSYSLQFASAELPFGIAELKSIVSPDNPYISTEGAPIEYDNGKARYLLAFGDEIVATWTYSDGHASTDRIAWRRVVTSATVDAGDEKRIGYTLLYDVGLSYVSFGSWNWQASQRKPDGNNEALESGAVYFVHGDRTLAGAIPTSGTATYSARSLNTYAPSSDAGGAVRGFPFGLTVDFGQRTISTEIKQGYGAGQFDDVTLAVIPGLDLRGTGSLDAQGDIEIPLAGTLTTGAITGRQGNQIQQTRETLTVSGQLSGAFFGPDASQMGGVFAVGQTPGKPLLTDSFVGARN